jgi:hypothetical protein
MRITNALKLAENVCFELSAAKRERRVEEASERERMKSAAIGAVLGLCAMAGTIHAAEIPNMVGTWKPSGASAGGRVGHAHAGWTASTKPVLNPTPRPTVVVEVQSGRSLAGYELLPDGSQDPFVAAFKHDGKQLVVSTTLGAATADVSGDEMEWCWQGTLPNVVVAVCDVMKKVQ